MSSCASLGDPTCTTAIAPELKMLTETAVRRAKPLRQPRKLFDGGGLYLLVVPKGGRYWRYNYRFNGKQKTLALGVLSRRSAREGEGATSGGAPATRGRH